MTEDASPWHETFYADTGSWAITHTHRRPPCRRLSLQFAMRATE
jgi:hypothetical protein